MDNLNVKDAAARWIARREREDWCAANEAELEQWLAAATANRVAFMRLQATWRKADRLKVLGAGFESGVVPSLADFKASPFFRSAPVLLGQPDLPPKRAGRRLWRIAAVAAIVVLFAGGGWMWHQFSRTAYSTRIGVIASVPLPDGSKITLNTDSQIRVSVTQRERRVSLDHGEAFFEVAKDRQHPFIVSVADKRIIVVGTKFSVRRVEDDVRVVVTEGKVRIERENGFRAANAPPVAVPAGKIAETTQRDITLREASGAQTEELLGWRSGYVVFHNTTLADAAREFNRYNDRKFVIEDPAIAGIRISGNFLATSVESFSRLLEDGFPIVVQRHEDSIVLSRR